MDSMSRRWFAFLALLALPVAAIVRDAFAEPPEDRNNQFAEGKELFTREWVPNDKRSYAGDGLGPVFNGRSCAECHSRSGLGGAGQNETNTTIISAIAIEDAGGTIKQPNRVKLAEIHPALRTESSFSVHRFGSREEFKEWKSQFDLWKTTRVMVDGRERVQVSYSNRDKRDIDAVQIELVTSHRNAPALFGAGIIDRIPDRVLENVAAEQAKAAELVVQAKAREKKQPYQFDLASMIGEPALPLRGRLPRLKNGRVGHFGWKSQTASLREFTLQACANELGLEVPGFKRAVPPWNQGPKAAAIDLSVQQCDQLYRFVASLPVPERHTPETLEGAVEVSYGRMLFTKIGCADCHRPKLGDVEGIYSDLLLHDMGQDLSDEGSYFTTTAGGVTKDQVEPLPEQRSESASSSQEKKAPRFRAGPREWRTPPLWGFRDSGPYMHDGRARNLSAAVATHGGEGVAAGRAFYRLTPNEQRHIEQFLQSLTAPKQVQ
jgi:CxxC motif-containing protein (DUF1111 family)